MEVFHSRKCLFHLWCWNRCKAILVIETELSYDSIRAKKMSIVNTTLNFKTLIILKHRTYQLYHK